MSKLVCSLALALACVSVSAQPAPAPSGKTVVEPIMKAEEGVLKAKVVELNIETRSITLKGKGAPVSFHVPSDVQNLDKVKVGDEVRALIIEAAAVSLEPQTTPAK